MRFTKLAFAFVIFHKALNRASPLTLGIKTIVSLYRINQRLDTPGKGERAGQDGVMSWNEH